jgi:hypothetical protein
MTKDIQHNAHAIIWQGYTDVGVEPAIIVFAYEGSALVGIMQEGREVLIQPNAVRELTRALNDAVKRLESAND